MNWIIKLIVAIPIVIIFNLVIETTKGGFILGSVAMAIFSAIDYTYYKTKEIN